MLVLMRRKGESILIYPDDLPEDMTVAELFAGGPIRIEIAATHHAQCKLAIDAPRELTIMRDDAKSFSDPAPLIEPEI
jgi:sRNA-binding carbon storage regulator CsrA